jgi:hypothetical protein
LAAAAVQIDEQVPAGRVREEIAEEIPIAETSTAMSAKRGRKMKYDWPDVRDFVFETISQKGEFQEWDTEWKCQADLERLVTGYMGKRQEHPSVSTVREYVSKYLKEWRAVQAGS